VEANAITGSAVNRTAATKKADLAVAHSLCRSGDSATLRSLSHSLSESATARANVDGRRETVDAPFCEGLGLARRRLERPAERALERLWLARSEPTAEGRAARFEPAPIGGSWLNEGRAGVPARLGRERRLSGASGSARRRDRARSGWRDPWPRVSALRPGRAKKGWFCAKIERIR
jgi:hypothetical protein